MTCFGLARVAIDRSYPQCIKLIFLTAGGGSPAWTDYTIHKFGALLLVQHITITGSLFTLPIPILLVWGFKMKASQEVAAFRRCYTDRFIATKARISRLSRRLGSPEACFHAFINQKAPWPSCNHVSQADISQRPFHPWKARLGPSAWFCIRGAERHSHKA